MTKFKVFTLIALVFSSFSQADIIHSERSLYRNIIVDQKHSIRCLKFSVKRQESSQSCINIDNPNELVFSYSKLLFSSLLLLEEPPKNVLVIGLGGGTMSNIISDIYPNVVVDNVEIDPAVVKVAREYFGFKENDNLRAIIKDGRIFAKRAALKKQTYDWIILDAFNGDYIPEHLMTREFLEEIKSLLSENGVLSANTFSSSTLYDHESATYQAVFKKFYNVRFNDSGNRIILTGKKGLATQAELESRAAAHYDNMLKYNVNLMKILISMDSKQDWPDDTRVLTDQYSPANLLK